MCGSYGSGFPVAPGQLLGDELIVLLFDQGLVLEFLGLHLPDCADRTKGDGEDRHEKPAAGWPGSRKPRNKAAALQVPSGVSLTLNPGHTVRASRCGGTFSTCPGYMGTLKTCPHSRRA